VDKKGVGHDTYGALPGQYSEKLLAYFPQSRWERMATQPVHLDPEFKTYTYGDATSPKQSLARLIAGDFLVFCCGLQQWDSIRKAFDGQPALYVVGYFEVELAGTHPSLCRELGERAVNRRFKNNFHVRYRRRLQPQGDRLILIGGGPGSRRFRKAYRISQLGNDQAGRPLKVLSREMRQHFGTFGELNSLQRSTPRWVEPRMVKHAIRFLRNLE
jgi:hypothetical protein